MLKGVMGHTYLATLACVCAWHSSWYLVICSAIALSMASLSFWIGSFRRPPCREQDISLVYASLLTLSTHYRNNRTEAAQQQMWHL